MATKTVCGTNSKGTKGCVTRGCGSRSKGKSGGGGAGRRGSNKCGGRKKCGCRQLDHIDMLNGYTAIFLEGIGIGLLSGAAIGSLFIIYICMKK